MSEHMYKDGKVYRLLCSDGYYYIGSTINKLNYRLNNHKNQSRSGNSRVYNHIKNIGWENVCIELIEDYPSLSKEELVKREDYFISLCKNDEFCLNFNRAYVTKEEKLQNMHEYYLNHKEELAEYQQKYKEENKEKVDEYQAEYRKLHAEKRRAYSKQYSENNPEWKKEYDKNYYETNKEDIIKKTKEYVEKNKERIQERKKQWVQRKKEENKETIQIEKEEKKKVKAEIKQKKKEEREECLTCECGGSYQPYRKSRHDSSKKHSQFLSGKIAS